MEQPETDYPGLDSTERGSSRARWALRDPMVDYLALANPVLDRRAEAGQVVARLEAAPDWPLAIVPAPRRSGVYALYLRGGRRPVYVGKAQGALGLQGRLAEHARTIQLHEGVRVDDVRCRFVAYGKRAPILALEAALIRHYRPLWNALVGFGSGPSRKGLPPVGRWEERYPRRS